MANLTSPGIQVSVSDESVYGPASAGTVPMLFIATGTNKTDPTGTETDGIAKYTKSANAGKPILVTSQRELTQYYGNVDFRTVSGTVQQGDETNDYGLLAAYSFLGQSSAAYIVRGDVNLTQLRPSSTAPTGAAANNTYWLNPSASKWGIYKRNAGATAWDLITPTVEITNNPATLPTATVVANTYAVTVALSATATTVTYFDNNGTIWAPRTANIVFKPHYSEPTGGDAAAGDLWIKTTTPGIGIDLSTKLYTTTGGAFAAAATTYVDASAPDGTANDFPADGTAGVARTLVDGDIWLDIDTSGFAVKRYDLANTEWDNISTDASVATGGFVMAVATTQPTGAAANGTLWHDPDVNDLAIFEVVSDSGVQKWKRVATPTYATAAPSVGATGTYWIDTNATSKPAIYRSNGTAWVLKVNSDQSTSAGVNFGDITDLDTAVAGFVVAANVLSGGPNPLVLPVGTTGVNMCRSAGTTREYNTALTTTWKWRNKAPNQADGSGSFGRHGQRAVVVAAMQSAAAGSELSEGTLSFSLIAAPGYAEMFDEMVTLNASRDETAFIIVDAPMRKNATEAVTWIGGTGGSANGEDALVGSNTYAAAYYPSVLTTDPVSGLNVVAPPSHSVLFTMAYSDNVSFPWFAPAGLTRGVVQNATNVGYLNSEDEFTPLAVTQGHRDAMYAAKLNPIARFPSDGIVVFGQKTLHSGTSSLDRVNVARLTAYLRERFAVIGRPYLFEPNDASTRLNAAATFDGFMSGILLQRGVYDYAVQCDTTNNTQARIDANELWIDIALEPTKSAEFIYIPIRLVNTGELAG